MARNQSFGTWLKNYPREARNGIPDLAIDFVKDCHDRDIVPSAFKTAKDLRRHLEVHYGNAPAALWRCLERAANEYEIHRPGYGV